MYSFVVHLHGYFLAFCTVSELPWVHHDFYPSQPVRSASSTSKSLVYMLGANVKNAVSFLVCIFPLCPFSVVVHFSCHGLSSGTCGAGVPPMSCMTAQAMKLALLWQERCL